MKNNSIPFTYSLLVGLASLFIIALLCIPPISQSQHYHNFSDTSTLLGIPNFFNVVSNLPFCIIGLIGILHYQKSTWPEFPSTAIRLFFVGVFLTGLGSGYYHLSPTNHTLVWDRLPMTLTFATLLSAVISLHLSPAVGKRTVFLFLLFGIGSVAYWYWGEMNNRGDLRPYIVVQFYPILAIPLIMIRHPFPETIKKLLIPMIGSYLLAKVFEHFDAHVYAFGHLISGHTIKHLFAALATYPVLSATTLYSKNQSITKQ